MEEDKVNDKEVVNSVTNLVKAIPIYQDGLQPAVKEIGKALGTVGKTVNIALAPISALVWGYDQIKDFVEIKVGEKLKDIPEEKIITPDETIAGPLLESLRYTGHKEELKEMYANLLASSMNADKADNAHPSFVDIIKNMNMYEARIIQYLAKNNALPMIHIRQIFSKRNGGGIYINKYLSMITYEIDSLDRNLLPTYYENLMRLKLIDIPYGRYLSKENIYNDLENDELVLNERKMIDNLDDSKSEIERTYIQLTNFGKLFTVACVDLHDSVKGN